MPAELIIFDMDGVLTDSERLMAGLVTEVLCELDYPITEAEVVERFMGIATAVQLGILRQERSDAFVQAYKERIGPRWRQVMARELKPAPGVHDLLARLDQRERRRCVASNGSLAHIHESLALVDLEGQFARHHRFSGTDVARPKPAPDLHHHFLRIFDMKPDQALVLEDSVTGLKGAVAAGIEAWGFVGLHPRPEQQADALLAAGAARVLWSWDELE